MTTSKYFSNCTFVTSVGTFSPGVRIPDAVIAAMDPKILARLAEEKRINEFTPRPPVEVKTGMQAPTGAWVFEMKDLELKTLDELNMMIRDHVLAKGLAPVQPFADRDEALFWMVHDRADKGGS